MGPPKVQRRFESLNALSESEKEVKELMRNFWIEALSLFRLRTPPWA